MAGTVLCACLATLTAIIVAASALGTAPSPQTHDSSHQPSDPAALSTSVASTRSHPVYRYSVIAGGAHSRQELADAIVGDRVVADHYRTVSLDRVRVERLTEERRAYVSYRVGDRVFWTKHRVTLPAGERILTDGVTQIRARCGNCISFEPQLPTSDAEPDVLEFEALAPPAPETAPLLAALPGSASSPLTLTGPTAPSSAPGIREWGRLPLAYGTGLANGIPISDARHKTVVETLAVPTPEQDGHGHDPDSVLIDSILGGSGPGGSNPSGSNPDRPDGHILYEPLPGTLIPRPTPGPGEFGDNHLSPDAPIQPVPVPEPSTIVLLGTGVAGALWRKVRSRRSR